VAISRHKNVIFAFKNLDLVQVWDSCNLEKCKFFGGVLNGTMVPLWVLVH